MNTTTFEKFLRAFSAGVTRRTAIGAVVTGAIAATSSTPLGASNTSARKKKRKKKNKKNQTPPAPKNVCAGKNWCVDRNQVCGTAGGFGKCLVEATGGNLCAEILFQAATCADCAAPACTNCRCVLAAGGGDRCNNGANGYDFICVRPV